MTEKKRATQLAVSLKDEKTKNAELSRRVIAANEALGKANVRATLLFTIVVLALVIAYSTVP